MPWPKICYPLAILLGGFAAVTSAWATELETVVVTGRAVDSSRNDIAGSVGVVDALDLSLIQATHINEAADRIAGVWISRGNGQEHLTAIRSPVLTGPGSCGAFLILEDGVPTRPSGFCNVNQLFEINSEQAERIEVYKGPNGAVYGNNALHGIINVITPAVGDRERSRLMLDAGPHDYARAFVSYTDGASLRINAHGDHDGGYKDDAGFDQQKLNIKSVTSINGIRMESLVELNNLNQETAGYVDGINAYKDDSRKKENLDADAFRDASSAHGYIKISGTVGSDKKWQLIPYANTSRMEFLQHWIPTSPLEINGHESMGLNGQLSYPLGGWGDKNTSMVSGFGLESSRASINEFQSRPTLGGFVQGQHYDFDVWMNSLALFTEAETFLSDSLKLIGGIRYEQQRYQYTNNIAAITSGIYTRPDDRDDRFGNFGVNAGILWQLSASGQLFVNAATGFRAPQIAELYRLEGGTPSHSVDSEKIHSIELGWRSELKPRWGDKLFYETSLFYMEKDHVIVKKYDRQYVGNAQTSHEGVELSLDYHFLSRLYLKSQLTYAEHRYQRIKDQLQGSPAVDLSNNIIDTAPRHMGSIQLGSLQDWGVVEVELKHMGSYYLDPEHDWAYEGHNLLNARIQYAVNDRLSLTARLLNIANVDYAERADVNASNIPRYFIGEPRTLYLSAEMTF